MSWFSAKLLSLRAVDPSEKVMQVPDERCNVALGAHIIIEVVALDYVGNEGKMTESPLVGVDDQHTHESASGIKRCELL